MTGRPGLTDASLRDALRRRVAETSLRAVADEVGMSFNGLNHVLAGGSPQRKTREKLVRWYYSQSTGSRAIPHEDFETAIALVLSYLRDESKPRAVRERRLREIIDRLKEDAD